METRHIWWDRFAEEVKNLGFDNIKSIEPEKVEINHIKFLSKKFSFSSTVASKGYFETITVF